MRTARISIDVLVFGNYIKFVGLVLAAALKVRSEKNDTRYSTHIMPTNPSHEPLIALLKRLPSVDPRIRSGVLENGLWWVKFQIDIEHPLAWRVVQELGHILNCLSTTAPLPSVFKPVSPPVYLNGGPKDFLAWVIESTHPTFTTDRCFEWLEGRLPRPLEDMSQWEIDD